MPRFISEKYERTFNRVKQDALRNGFTEEELERIDLSKISKKTKSSRIYRFIEWSYYLGWLKGIQYCDEMLNTRITIRGIGEPKNKLLGVVDDIYNDEKVSLEIFVMNNIDYLISFNVVNIEETDNTNILSIQNHKIFISDKKEKEFIRQYIENFNNGIIENNLLNYLSNTSCEWYENEKLRRK